MSDTSRVRLTEAERCAWWALLLLGPFASSGAICFLDWFAVGVAGGFAGCVLSLVAVNRLRSEYETSSGNPAHRRAPPLGMELLLATCGAVSMMAYLVLGLVGMFAMAFGNFSVPG